MSGRLRETLLAAVIAIVLTGCGSDDEGGTIPQANADALLAQLSSVEEAVAGGDCDTAQSRAGDFVQVVNELPAAVGVETKDALREAGTNLADLAAAECQPSDDTTTTTDDTTTTEETEPETTTTTTTTEETTTDDTTTDETTTEEEPPEDEDSSGQGPGGGGEPPSGGLGPGGGGEG
jgi:hypothetical protein